MQRKNNAKKLRESQTPEEEKLWSRIKDRRLGGYKFRRQVPLNEFIVDFCCLDKRLVIEIDGFQHIEKKPKDFKRDRYLESQGFKVMRFWNSEINQDIERVLDKIIKELESPSSALRAPSPVKGEGQEENYD